MEQSVKNGLQNKDYDIRKKTALAFEPYLRELSATKTAESEQKLRLIITQLVELAGTKLQSSSATTTIRSGGIMGLASLAIALGPRLAEYLGPIIAPVLACFEDHDSKLRYYACESMYNITKVAHGEVLVYFNELFDALSKLTADSDPSVKNGAELLDRLLKDIVTEQAGTYISLANYGPEETSTRPGAEKENIAGEGSAGATSRQAPPAEPPRAFSLPRFMPLLYDRITVRDPWVRTFLISWLVILNQVPDLELVSYLPDFLEGLLVYLGDPTYEVRTQTEILLETLLREVGVVREVQLELLRSKREAWDAEMDRRRRRASEARTVTVTDRDDEDETRAARTEAPKAQAADAGGPEGAEEEAVGDSDSGSEHDADEEDDAGEWIPGQGVRVDYPAIVEILLRFVSVSDEEVQATCLHWLGEFLQIVPGVLIPFAPRLIPVILSALAHHVPEIQQAAVDTNEQLFSVVQSLPVDGQPSFGANRSPITAEVSPSGHSPLPFSASAERAGAHVPALSSVPFPAHGGPSPSFRPGHDRSKPGSDVNPISAGTTQQAARTLTSLSLAPTSPAGARGFAYPSELQDEFEPDGRKFQYGATVSELTLQFLSDNEETRVAALEWLLMLHQKAPRKILAGDDPSLLGRRDRPQAGGRQRHPSTSSTSSGLSLAVLLKLLSDSSERVLRYDLQLLAQISSLGDGSGGSSGENYFSGLMTSLLELFSTDRKLLETRGSLIIRQLCGSLNAERIYRTCAEILEADEDLDFSSIMVQNLNLIMITSPELNDFRKRLRTLDSKDGQNLFVTLYRSWSHNAVATFTLCLLAQAYEQASALLQIFAELEMTVPMLIQIDKLVQLIESPVFTSLRLQLLEPDKHPYLLKAMYGLLMLLPQSSAFATLRNRLSAVSSLGFLQTVPRSSLAAPAATRGSTFSGSQGAGGAASSIAGRVARPDGATPDPPSIRWHELLAHFRAVQKRRAAVIAAAGPGGRTHGGVDMPAGSGRGGSRTRDGTVSTDGISPPTSSGFAHPSSRSAKRRPETGQAAFASLGGGARTASGNDGASVTSSNVTAGSGGRGPPRAGAAQPQRALSPTLSSGAKGRPNNGSASAKDGRAGGTGGAKR
ncbi:hypothetical protein JCM8202_002588 [Rhodotorula sphaerocarpa]